MKTRNASKVLRYLAPVPVLAALLLPRTSAASASFPEAINEKLQMQCAPTCTACHRTMEGGLGTVEKKFGVAMLLAGLRALEPETVGPALDALELNMTDSDGDLSPDVGELRVGSDPNVAGDGVTDALLCGPAYGCGARIAPSPSKPLDAGAFGLALAVAGWLLVRRRS